MNVDDDTKRFLIDRLKWFGLYLGIGLILIILLPFPYDFISVLGLFILINFWRWRSLIKRYRGISGIKEMFGSLSSYKAGNDQHVTLKYYCMSRGKELKEIACPN
jgi:hypothetical protein